MISDWQEWDFQDKKLQELGGMFVGGSSEKILERTDTELCRGLTITIFRFTTNWIGCMF